MKNTKVSAGELNRLSTESYRISEKADIYIILDNLRSGQNIGSIFRTADAFRVKKIWITGHSALPPNKEIMKTALGATDTVAWSYHENAIELVQKLKAEKIKVYAVEQTQNSILLNDFILENSLPIALIFGNEVEGVNQELINLCHGCIEIPQFGTKHSLNVAVSSGIVIWHLMNQMLSDKTKVLK